MAVDLSSSKTLFWILDSQKPHRVGTGKRVITLSYSNYFDNDWLVPAARELQNPSTADALNSAELAVLASIAGSKCDAGVNGAVDFAATVKRIVERRWSELAVPLGRVVLADPHYGKAVLAAIPQLTGSSELIDAMIEVLEDGVTLHLYHVLDLRTLRIEAVDQVRRLLPLTKGQYDKNLNITVLWAAARAQGWTSWLKLQTILYELPDLAGEKEGRDPFELDAPNGELGPELRRDAWREIVGDRPTRQVAQLIRDLDGALAYSTPDMRSVYVGRLRRAIGSDAALRQATIEALLDRPRQRQEDLGLYTATVLTLPEDEDFIEQLLGHPRRDVGYRAGVVKATVFDRDQEACPWPRPTMTGLAEGLFQIRLGASAREQSGTWLGDRLLEQMIEHTSASEEERFARDYPDFSESDEEDGLLRTFFSDLARQFGQLDQALLATARATRTARRTRLRIDYRSVSNAEEGGVGISRTGKDEDASDSFSADLCLIVDPYLDGKALGKRATLIQAKRLYRRDARMPEKGFASSYRLKTGQMKDLLDQTDSSFYMFQGPGSHGRAIPILPTQLVADLAYHQAPSAGQIDHDVVGLASQSFAQWLTYEVLALRTGDPLEQLVAKAEGGEGRRPRPLARVAEVEIEVRSGDPLKEGE